MNRSWYVLPDGSYAPLSQNADLLLETKYTMEDAYETSEALAQLRVAVRAARLESRRLISESRRQRRLRTTHLRLVRKSV